MGHSCLIGRSASLNGLGSRSKLFPSNCGGRSNGSSSTCWRNRCRRSPTRFRLTIPCREKSPEDRDDAEIVDGAGEIGFFSPGSHYPFGIALASLVPGVGLVFLMWWLIAVGIIGILIACAGLLFEYYTGARRAH